MINTVLEKRSLSLNFQLEISSKLKGTGATQRGQLALSI